MSILRTLQRTKEFINRENGEIAPLPITEERLNPQVQDDLSVSAVPLEDTNRCYEVNYNFPENSSFSEISFFEDGKQQTVQIGFIPTSYGSSNVIIPVHFFVVAAVILKRENKKLKIWAEPELRSGILIERSLVPDQSVLQEFENLGLVIIDTNGQGGDYYDLKRKALRESKRQRLIVENSLIERWGNSEESNDNYLLVDGTLMNLRGEQHLEKCIGVSKSFGSRYFSISDHNRILQMEEFQRSWAFRFHSTEDESDDPSYGSRERISWYLRLRKLQNVDPEFGLIRVEVSQRYASRASEFANRFSSSLLSERLPTSYPAPRWDNHLYPIRACENYLSSIMPSIETIKASMKG